ncbi:phosphopantetheine-binding protein, partial [Streptomyces sp. NPDC097619]|uniref:phosphopantetheine-binding protein n=1 Tax=Streptomyces sp. NPDC097619 TaxID=3157228 RepID=UPI0033343457
MTASPTTAPATTPDAPLPDRAAGPEGPFGLDRLLDDVADVLGAEPEEIDPDENLLDQGLDSIRLMSLVTRWRNEGARVAFVDLAERPTLREWAALLAPAGPGHRPLRRGDGVLPLRGHG